MEKLKEWKIIEKGIRCRMHPVRKHGKQFDKYYVLRFTVDGKQHQESLGWASEGITLEKARIELAKLREAHRTGEGPQTLTEKKRARALQKDAMIEKGRLEAIKAITFKDYWEQNYFPAQSHKSRGSLDAEAGLWIKWLKPVIADIPLHLLKPTELETVKVNMIKALKSPATIKYAMAVVSQVWTMAVRDTIVEGLCPTKSVQLPKKDNRRQRYLSKPEATMLLECLKSKSLQTHDISVIALDCGLRFGEIASLSWQDCDFERGTLLIRDPKAYSSRYAFMTKRVRDVLQNRYMEQDLQSGLIFLDTNGNKLERISKTFRRIADDLFNTNVSDSRQRVCFHTLRHSFASRLAEHGVSLYEIKELMGHSDFSMTQRYSHLSPEGLRNAINVLEE